MLLSYLLVVLYKYRVITSNMEARGMTTTITTLKPFMVSDDGLIIYNIGIKTNGQGFLKTSEGLCYVNTDGCTFSINGKKYNLFNFSIV